MVARVVVFGACVWLATCATTQGQTQGAAGATDPAPPFTFKVGGYFKPQMNFDFSPAGNPDLWDPRTIPVDGSTGQNFRVHARDTRLSLEVRGPVQGREVRMFVETDFAEGTGYTLRLRHAYGTWGPLLAGQTWSTYMDELVIPRTIDLEPPASFPFLRVAQFRLTKPLSGGGTWSVAIEDPAHKIDIPPTLSGQEEHAMPDVTGRLRWVRTKWHTQLSGFAGMVGFRATSGSAQRHAIWGLALGGKTALGAKDAVSGQVTTGKRRRPVPERHRGLVRRRRDAASHRCRWRHRRLRPQLVRALHVHGLLRVGERRYQWAAHRRSDAGRHLRHRQPAVVVPARARVVRRRVPLRPPARWTVVPRARPAACSSR